MKLINRIKKIEAKTWIKVILASIFLMMLVLNFLTPLIADDFSYGLGVDQKRITNVMDIVNRMIDHYFGWGGRIVSHTFACTFLMLPKVIFNILNSAVYTTLIYLIYKISKGKNKEEKPLLLLGIHFILYFLTPVFGQNCIWLVGACNYIWTTCIILLLVYSILSKNDKKDSIIRLIAMFLFGVISGWTNENTSFGLITILSSILIIDKINKEKIPKWKISGLIGSIIGFIIMIAAPGNYVRSAEFVDNDFIIIKWIKRFIECTMGMGKYCTIFIAALVILITIYIFNHKKINKYVYGFALGAILSVYSMVLSPSFPERSWFGVIVFFTIAIMILLYDIEKISKIFKPIIIDAIIISSFIYIVDFISLVKDINGLRMTWNDRIELIKNGDGENPIILTPYYTNNTKNPNYGLADIVHDQNDWPNRDIARYYGQKELIIDYMDGTTEDVE